MNEIPIHVLTALTQSVALHYKVVNILNNILNKSTKASPYEHWLWLGQDELKLEDLQNSCKKMGDKLQRIYDEANEPTHYS